MIFEIDARYNIEGLDLSVELIKIARRNVPGCPFWVQDIRDIALVKQYDAIVASFCIVHFSDEETTSFSEDIFIFARKTSSSTESGRSTPLIEIHSTFEL